MVITIYEGYDKSYITLGSKDERFQKAFGYSIRVPANLVYRSLSEVCAYVNNELGEDCLFEVD